jgi:hypothetical protein
MSAGVRDQSMSMVTRKPRLIEWMRGILQMLGFWVVGLLLLLLTVWAAAALYFDVRVSWLRTTLAVMYLLTVLAVCILIKSRWRKMTWIAGGFVLVLAWWFTLQPSNYRDWQRDVALLAYADIDGNKVTVHNIRNCDYPRRRTALRTGHDGPPGGPAT